MKQGLQLAWPDKDRILLGLDGRGQPRWGTAADLTPRALTPMQTIPARAEHNGRRDDNLLIQGNNLLALKSLEAKFTGRIQCAYIDPPFNTGNAFTHYDDDLEDVLWLSLIKPRLEHIRTLLKSDGLIVVHIDHRELAQLKLLMDEIFGKKNFVSLIW